MMERYVKIVGMLFVVLLIIYLIVSGIALAAPNSFFVFCEGARDNTATEQCRMLVLVLAGPIGLLSYFQSLWGNFESVVEKGFLSFYVTIFFLYVGFTFGIVFFGIRFFLSFMKQKPHFRWIIAGFFLWGFAGLIAASFLT